MKTKLTHGNKSLDSKDADLANLRSELEAEVSAKSELEGRLQELEEAMTILKEAMAAAEKQVIEIV